MSGCTYIRKLTDDADPWYVRLLPWAPAVLLGVALGIAITLAGLCWLGCVA